MALPAPAFPFPLEKQINKQTQTDKMERIGRLGDRWEGGGEGGGICGVWSIGVAGVGDATGALHCRLSLSPVFSLLSDLI